MEQAALDCFVVPLLAMTKRRYFILNRSAERQEDMTRQHEAKGQAGKAPTQRQLRVGEMLRHALADLLTRTDVADPELEGRYITVTEVKTSPDLRHATIFVRPFGTEENGPAIVKALNRHQRFLRGELGRRVDLKFTPDLTFRLDESFDEAERIDALLRSPTVQRDLD
jgi:ribosome-binding factor A